MKTPLAELHVRAGARLIQFAGWEMPLHYGSQLAEHHAVRNGAGCFDVSHMAVLDMSTTHGEQILSRLLVGDVTKLNIGAALYTLMLNERGGIVDDLIVYRREDGYRLVVNASTTAKDLAWIAKCENDLDAAETVQHRKDLCIVAVQGPQAVAHASAILAVKELSDLAPFAFIEQHDYFIARTGYTGEDGVEVICPADAACTFWRQLLAVGITPAGLGARDSLRLEAGLNLYGHDMTEETNPFECRIAWTVDWKNEDRPFIGREALEHVRNNGSPSKLTGLKLEKRAIPREGCIVKNVAGEGVVTSGAYSPTLGCGIALARLPRASRGICHVHIRQRAIPAKITRLPFVRKDTEL